MPDPIIMPEISRVTLPSGNQYQLKDLTARELIAELQRNAVFLGVTTTQLTEGETDPDITIDGETVTARTGDWTITSDEKKEFIYNGTFWQEFGDMSDLGSLAYKDTASGTYTPQGTISRPTLTGTQATITVTGTPAGTINEQSFTGDEATVNVSGTAQAQVFTGSPVDYTPAGTNSGGDVTLSKTNIQSITSVGTLPSAVMPTFTVSEETLIIGASSWDAGTLPTREQVSVAVDVDTITQPTFSGTAAQITAEGTNAASTVSASGTTTPTGTIEQAAFTGSELSSSGSYTPAGEISIPLFTGTEATITVS